MATSVTARLLEHIDEIAAGSWNALTQNRFPYLRHEFLSALENTGCVTREAGWTPRHLILEGSDGTLLAAAPMYLKTNSFGEFVFDWAWADAYHRAGLAYYPKLVIAAPFTPTTGPRLLVHPGSDPDRLRLQLLSAAVQRAHHLGVSSLHCLFCTASETGISHGLLLRQGCQFHWHNRGYHCFEDFLAQLTSKRRKQIRRERRHVTDAGLTIRWVRGHQADDRDWESFYALYRSTFFRYGNHPALTLPFFREIGRTMGEQVLLVLASRGREIIAGSFFLVGENRLYGRYWGSREHIPDLHFELCFYQGQEYCIEHRLQDFEPGAGGEHKISRGFEPTITGSLHWIRQPAFRRAIADFLQQERSLMTEYLDQLHSHSPFRQSDTRCWYSSTH